LVAATQRPSTDVLTGVIKSNIPTRISFHTASYIDSMTCLDQRGAEMLLSCGDMLYSESGKPAIRIHSAFISNKEIEKVAKFLRSQGEPEYDDGVVMSGDGIGNAALGLPPSKGEKDGDLYNQAVEYVVRDKRPTITYIQRRLGIGYGRAVGLFEKMEANGIVRRKPDGKYELA
jgi:S-DNA-T family DNA segregation ATPase FtsK/SpoIIIE